MCVLLGVLQVTHKGPVKFLAWLRNLHRVSSLELHCEVLQNLGAVGVVVVKVEKEVVEVVAQV